MKINEAIELRATDQIINDLNYKILLWIQHKKSGEILEIPWSLINNFTYVDDIFECGLKGELIIDNLNGIFNNLLNFCDEFYIGFYANNGFYIDHAYYSIVKSDLLNSIENINSQLYKLYIQEAFIVEGANRSATAFPIGDTIQTIPELAKYCLATIDTNFNFTHSVKSRDGIIIPNIQLELSDVNFKSIDFDEDSKNNIIEDDTLILGTNIYRNLTEDDSIQTFLEKLNTTFFVPKESNSLVGIPCTLKSENISFNTSKIDPNRYGHRKLTIRNLNTTFRNVFGGDKLKVYEWIGQELNKPNNIDSIFTSKIIPFNISNLPVNLAFVNNEWSDIIIGQINAPDTYSNNILLFENILNIFEQTYLNDRYVFNIRPLGEKKTSLFGNNNPSNNPAWGITRKVPLYNNNQLNYTIGSKAIKTLFTLNKMVTVSLPGEIYRKSNEIIYIDKALGDIESDNNAYNNILNNEFYFVDRVVHKFYGQKYINELYICAFAKPLS